MNGRHLWMDTDTSGNSCYLTDCESLVGVNDYYCLHHNGKHPLKSDRIVMSKLVSCSWQSESFLS